jgi:tetratricopeptide (TPR) repeat protein
VKEANSSIDAEFERSATRWLKTSAPEDAEEFVGLALLSNRLEDPRVEFAALSLIENAGEDEARLAFVRRVLSHGAYGEAELPAEEAQIRIEIAKRKRLLDLNPRDALRLAESALLYVSVGQTKSASSLLQRALILRPDDRYVLRASSRFFMHLGDPDEALFNLSRSQATTADPWLRSALFAVQAASGREATGWRKARTLLGDASFSARDVSELAVQMGSMEYASGARRQAIRMLRQGAQSPTENAVAQIGWVARHRADFKHAELNVDVSLSHEASAYAAYEGSAWEDAVAHCGAWRKVEPFSVRPAILATFIGCVSMEALEAAGTVGTYGLLANPRNKTLLNNLAAVKALQGRFDDARLILRKAKAANGDNDDDVVVTATEGLIDFREGNYEAGIKRYTAALDKAVEIKNRSLAFRAICYFSREVARVDGGYGRSMLEKLGSLIDKMTDRGMPIPTDVRVMFAQIGSDLESDKAKTQAFASIGNLRWDEFIDDGNRKPTNNFLI